MHLNLNIKYKIFRTLRVHKVLDKLRESAGKGMNLLHQLVKVEIGDDDILWVASHVNNLAGV